MTTPIAGELSYRRVGSAYLEPSDTPADKNLEGVRYLQATVAGTITVKHGDDSLSVPIPLAANQSWKVGDDMVHVMATDTSFTSSQLIPYYG